MRLIIVRHGETTHNRDKITQGDLDTELTDLGRRQAEALAKRLLREKIDVIYSSDLKRCRDTLEPFLRLRKIVVHYTKELREQSHGVFQERPYKEFTSWQDSKKGKKFEMKPEEGESFNDVMRRVNKFLDVILEKEKKILLMTHGITKRAILMSLFNKKDEEYYNELRELSKNTAMTIINLKNDGRHEVESLYSVEHLEDLDENNFEGDVNK